MAVAERQMWFDVWAADDLLGDAIGTLTEISDKQIRRVDNGIGQGSFTVNRNSADFANLCATDNLIRVRQEAGGPFDYDDERYVFAFFIEQGEDTILLTDEAGGETVRLAGRDAVVILARAVIDYEAHHPFNIEHEFDATTLQDAQWHINGSDFLSDAVGTPGSVLRIFLRDTEYQTPQPIPEVTHDFTVTDDSLDVTWVLGQADWDFEVGKDLLEVLFILVASELNFKMHPSLLLQAFEEHPGTDRTATVTLQSGVNVRESGTRPIHASPVKSRVLVKGSARDGAFTYRWVDDPTIEASAVGVRQGFLEYEATPTVERLDRAGERFLAVNKNQHDGPPVVGVLNEVGQVALEDYFPGDTVTVDIPEFDGPYAIKSITLVENESGYIDPIVEFVDEEAPNVDVPEAETKTPIRAGCAPCPSDFPYVPPEAIGHYYAGTMTFTNSHGGGGGAGYADMTPVHMSTLSSTNQAGGVIQPDTTYNGEVTVVGENPADLVAVSFALDTTAVYPPSGAVSGFQQSYGTAGNQSWSGSFTTMSTTPVDTLVHMNAKAQGAIAPPQTVTVTWWFDPDGWDTGADPGPAAGQQFGPSTVTMTGASGTAPYPFADGSLRVFHDGFEQTIHIASYDGATGDFTLDYTPDVGSTITVIAQGRQA